MTNRWQVGVAVLIGSIIGGVFALIDAKLCSLSSLFTLLLFRGSKCILDLINFKSVSHQVSLVFLNDRSVYLKIDIGAHNVTHRRLQVNLRHRTRILFNFVVHLHILGLWLEHVISFLYFVRFGYNGDCWRSVVAAD